MTREPIAHLYKDGTRFELVYPEYGVIVRGPHPEWVLEAGAEVLAQIDKTRSEGTIEEMEMLKEFNAEDISDMEIAGLKQENAERFNTVPQCIVQMGNADYRWVAKDGRALRGHQMIERLHDASLVRSNDWLTHQP